jgi:hypothetical protein
MQGGIMNDLIKRRNPFKCFTTLILLLSMVLMSVPLASAHGPKGHSGTEFTALSAVKKGIELYDKLVASGKLKAPWETDLKNIEVFSRQKSSQNRELVVKFSRSKDDPKSVYIFFTEKGDYSGSNFSGN